MKTLVLAALLLFIGVAPTFGETINTDCFACKKQRDLTKVVEYIHDNDIDSLRNYMKIKIYWDRCTILPQGDEVTIIDTSGMCVKVRSVEGDFWVWKWAVSPR